MYCLTLLEARIQKSVFLGQNQGVGRTVPHPLPTVRLLSLLAPGGSRLPLVLWQLCSTLQGQHFQVPPSAFTALSLLYLVTSPFASLLRGMHLIAFRAHLDNFGPSPHLRTPNFITRAKQSPYKVASIGSRDKDEGSFGGNFSSLSYSP